MYFLNVFILFLAVTTLEGKPEEKPAKALPCDDLQRCLSTGSRACWKKFYDEGRKKDDLISDILKACPEAEFMTFIDEAEAEMWPEFLQIDKNLTECMSESGHRVYVDFCSNMRSSKFNEHMEKAIEDASKGQPKPDAHRNKRQSKRPSSGDQGYKCWITTLKNCADQYKLPSEEIDKALGKCEKELNVVDNEERLGFEVGKRVMLKIVAKIKDVFDNEGEDIGDTKDPDSTKKESPQKPAKP